MTEVDFERLHVERRELCLDLARGQEVAFTPNGRPPVNDQQRKEFGVAVLAHACSERSSGAAS